MPDPHAPRPSPALPRGMGGWAGSATCRRYSGVRGEGGGCEAEMFLSNAADETWGGGRCAPGNVPPRGCSPRGFLRGTRRAGGWDGRCRSGALASAAPGWRDYRSQRQAVDRPAGAGAAVRVEKVVTTEGRGQELQYSNSARAVSSAVMAYFDGSNGGSGSRGLARLGEEPC